MSTIYVTFGSSTEKSSIVTMITLHAVIPLSLQKIELCSVVENANRNFVLRKGGFPSYPYWGGSAPEVEISTLQTVFSAGGQIHSRYTQKISRFWFF